jgi:NADH-quinone oxidoreductase subunit I
MKKNYIVRLFSSLWRLGQGMYVTLLNFVRPKVTEQYPENRGRHEYFERFRALLTMPHDEHNQHRCTACGICQMNCPNGTITVVSRTEDDPVVGKPKKVLDKHLYDLGSCTFCALCTQTCPQGAIAFTTAFEHSVFTKGRLVKQLNRPGSRLVEKETFVSSSRAEQSHPV